MYVFDGEITDKKHNSPFYSLNHRNAYVDENPLFSSLKIIKSKICFQHGKKKRGEFWITGKATFKRTYVLKDGFT